MSSVGCGMSRYTAGSCRSSPPCGYVFARSVLPASLALLPDTRNVPLAPSGEKRTARVGVLASSRFGVRGSGAPLPPTSPTVQSWKAGAV